MGVLGKIESGLGWYADSVPTQATFSYEAGPT